MFVIIIILSLLLVGLILLNIFLLRALSKSFNAIVSYEKLYNDISDDIQAILEFADALRKRDYLVEDPDVLKFYKVVEYLHNTLSGYVENMDDLRGLEPVDGAKEK